MKGYFVYILRCSDTSLYTGWTNDITLRFLKHAQGLASKYTRSKLPVTLVYIEELPSRSEAQKREIAIKKLRRKEKEMLITKNASITTLLKNNFSSEITAQTKEQ